MARRTRSYIAYDAMRRERLSTDAAYCAHRAEIRRAWRLANRERLLERRRDNYKAANGTVKWTMVIDTRRVPPLGELYHKTLLVTSTAVGFSEPLDVVPYAVRLGQDAPHRAHGTTVIEEGSYLLQDWAYDGYAL